MPGLTNRWRKSTRSGDNGACVQARALDGTTEIRDSKDQAGPILSVSSTAWRTFIAAVKRGEFDLS